MTKTSGGAALFLVLLIAIGANFLLTRQATVHNCQEIELVKDGLRATLQEAERFVTTSPVRGSAEKRASEAFYTDALTRLKPHHC